MQLYQGQQQVHRRLPDQQGGDLRRWILKLRIPPCAQAVLPKGKSSPLAIISPFALHFSPHCHRHRHGGPPHLLAETERKKRSAKCHAC